MSEASEPEMTDPGAEPSGRPSSGERVALHGDDPALRRKRALSVLFGVLLISAAVGGVFGLFLGRTGGLIAAAVVALPLLYVLAYSTRRQLWLEGGTLVARTWGTRRLELSAVKRLDLLITQVRGTRTVALLVGGERSSVKVDLAVYQAMGGRELGVLALRKLANALMNNTEANGMVFAELLVAQLRSEAKGDPVDERPLHRLAYAAPGDKIAQRYTMEALSRFVASLD